VSVPKTTPPHRYWIRVIAAIFIKPVCHGDAAVSGDADKTRLIPRSEYCFLALPSIQAFDRVAIKTPGAPQRYRNSRRSSAL
jgi:hypothetical protein